MNRNKMNTFKMMMKILKIGKKQKKVNHKNKQMINMNMKLHKVKNHQNFKIKV